MKSDLLTGLPPAIHWPHMFLGSWYKRALLIAVILFIFMAAGYGILLLRLSNIPVSQVTDSLTEQAGKNHIKLEYHGSRQDYLTGYVLTGVRISNENGEIFRCNSLQLQVSFSNILLGRGISRIRVSNGQLSVTDLQGSSSILNSFIALLHEQSAVLDLKNIQLKTRNKRNLNLSIYPQSSSNAIIEGILTDSDQGVLEFHSEWQSVKRNRVYLKAINTGLLSTLALLSGKLGADFIPLSVHAQTGTISAIGSIDLQEDGTAINLRGKLSNFSGVFFNDSISLTNQTGTFTFNSVQSFAKGLLKVDLTAQTEQLELVFAYSLEKGHTIKSTIHFNKVGPVLFKPLPFTGKVEVSSHISVNKKQNRIIWSPNIRAENLNFNHSISINKLSIESKPEAGFSETTILATGQLKKSPVQLKANGRFRFIRGENITLERNMNGRLDIDRYSYSELIHDIINIHSWMTKKAKDPKSTRIEDEGPLWLSEPETHPFYTRYIHGARDTFSIHFNNMTDAHSTPENFRIDASLNPLSLQADLRAEKTEKGRLSGYYRASFMGPAPDHQTEITFEARDSALQIQQITGSSRMLENWVFAARFNALGWYPADLINQSTGQLSLRAWPVDLTEIEKLKVIKRMVSMKELPRRADVRFFRSTSGTRVNIGGIDVRDESTDWIAAGAGEYSLHNGGSLALTLASQSRFKRKTIQLRILPDGRWLPDD